MESTPDELRFGQRTMEDPHAAMWEDGQWSKAGGDTWRSSVKEICPRGKYKVIIYFLIS